MLSGRVIAFPQAAVAFQARKVGRPQGSKDKALRILGKKQSSKSEKSACKLPTGKTRTADLSQQLQLICNFCVQCSKSQWTPKHRVGSGMTIFGWTASTSILTRIHSAQIGRMCEAVGIQIVRNPQRVNIRGTCSNDQKSTLPFCAKTIEQKRWRAYSSAMGEFCKSRTL